MPAAKAFPRLVERAARQTQMGRAGADGNEPRPRREDRVGIWSAPKEVVRLLG